MRRQVVLLGSSVETSISAWDVQTGTELTGYKANACPRNGMCLLGRDYLVSAQTTKDALQFYTWHKDQALQRSFIVEKATAVAASPCGTYVAAGGVSGSIYIWEVASGRLLRSWGAHYKGITCLAFSESGLMLFSGAEDTLASCWLLGELLDPLRDPSSPDYHRPQPLHSWSEHTLPVTSIYVGQGEACAIVVTVSLDRTLKVHRLSDGQLLRSVALPSGLHCVALDAGEHAAWAGASDGAIYEVPLVAGGGHTSTNALGGAPGGAAGSSLGAAAAGVVRMEGHSRAVNALAVCHDGETLVSGSDDGTALVWDLRSRQAVQVIQGQGKHPITCVLLLPQPEHMLAAGAGGGAGGGGRHGPKRPQPLAPLNKFLGMPGALKSWEGPPIVLDGSQPFTGIAQAAGMWGAASSLTQPPPSLQLPLGCSTAAPAFTAGAPLWSSALALMDGTPSAAGPGAAAANGTGPAGTLVSQGAAGVDGEGAGSEAALQKEVQQLRQQLAQAQAQAKEWQTLHGELHRVTVEAVLQQQP